MRYILKFLTPISHFSKTIKLILAFKFHENKPFQFVSFSIISSQPKHCFSCICFKQRYNLKRNNSLPLIWHENCLFIWQQVEQKINNIQFQELV